MNTTRLDLMRRMSRFAQQPDVRAQPVRGLYRRLRWRRHWRRADAPYFHIEKWTRNLSIDLPRSGSAAQVYYRKFSSPLLARAMTESLTTGMTMVDIGAHVGEYSLFASALVGADGRVDAFEPQEHLARLVRHNADLNGIGNVHVHPVAVSDHQGASGFQADTSRGAGWLQESADGGAIIRCTTLDALVADIGARIDFLKLDAAGNELCVLAGGARTLVDGAAPRIAYKLYHPRVAAARFGHDSLRAIEMFADYGYEQHFLTSSAHVVRGGSGAMEELGATWYCVPILAVKRAQGCPV